MLSHRRGPKCMQHWTEGDLSSPLVIISTVGDRTGAVFSNATVFKPKKSIFPWWQIWPWPRMWTGTFKKGQESNSGSMNHPTINCSDVLFWMFECNLSLSHSFNQVLSLHGLITCSYFLIIILPISCTNYLNAYLYCAISALACHSDLLWHQHFN